MARRRSSGRIAKVPVGDGRPGELNDEAHFLEIHSVMSYIDDARRRTERAVAALREDGAEEHLIEALERTLEDLSETARRLRQGTFFAVPKAQLSF